MDRQLQFDKAYLAMAHSWAMLSRAKRLKVGCLVVKDGQVISNGYNGTPSGFSNECELNGETKPEVLHAESNAIAKLARSTSSSEGATLYCTHSPCFDCAKLIIQAGIKRVVYTKQYRCIDGIELLLSSGITINTITLDNVFP